MDNTEKRTLNTETGAVEMNKKMHDRVHWIESQTYWYLMQLLELDMDEAKEKLPWDIEMLREILDETVSILEKRGYRVCDPYIAIPENGRQYRCTLSECGCGHCNCQNEWMEKERLISNIEDTIVESGLKIVSGGKDKLIARADSLDTDFEIRISELAG